MEGIVQNVARLSLADNGLTRLSEKIDHVLDDDYAGWQTPQGTTMVPRIFSKTKTDRGVEEEARVFRLLSNCQEPMFVVHSFKFKETIDGVTVRGEQDFVVIHRTQGLIFLEVKARNCIGKEYKHAIHQLQTGREATASHLLAVGGQLPDLDSFCRGYVIMPNCPRPKDPSLAGAFKQDCRDAASFSAWWESHINATTMDVPQELYEQLIRRFVGGFHIEPRPNQEVIMRDFVKMEKATEKHFKKMELATRQQLEALKIHRPRMWVTGPAGSGKTWLLLQKVRSLASTYKHNNILVLCFNKALSLYLKGQLWQQVAMETVTVMTYCKFLLKYLDISVESHEIQKLQKIEAVCYWQQVSHKFNHIFVDEGQDLFGQWPDLLELHLEKDACVDSPHFWVMFDPNQNVQPTANHQSYYQQELEQSLKLENVLRNPKKIFKLSRKHFSDSLGLFQNIKPGHNIPGPDIFWDSSLSGDLAEDANNLAKHVQQLHYEDNVPLNEISVLTRDKTARDNLIVMLKSIQVPCENAIEHICNNNDAVVVESVRCFKGLESKVIILFDPSNDQGLLYVALSRCNCYMIIFSTEELCECIKRK